MNGKLPVTNGCISLQSSVVPRREHQHCCKNGHCAWSKQRWSDLYLSAETLAKSAKLFMLCIWGLQIKHMYILYILYVHNGGGGSLYIHIYVYIAFPMLPLSLRLIPRRPTCGGCPPRLLMNAASSNMHHNLLRARTDVVYVVNIGFVFLCVCACI